MHRMLLVSALGSTIVALGPTPADAVPIDHPCGGERISSYKPLSDGGRSIGRVSLWYSSANGGTNCVMTETYLGRSATTWASLDVQKTGGGVRSDTDSGNYAGFAAVQLGGTDGHCVRWAGGTGSESGPHDSFHQDNWVFCG